MTRIVSFVRRESRPTLMVAIGIALLGVSWLIVGSSRSGAAPHVEKPIENVSVVGFGHIDVEGGTIPLSSAVPGKVEILEVKEGDRVRAGQRLLVLERQQAEAQVVEAEAALDQALVQRRQSARAAENHLIQRRLQEQAIRSAQIQVDATAREVEHIERLAGDDVVPNERLLAARDFVQDAQAAFEAENLRLRQLELDDPTETLTLADSAVRLAQARLSKAKDFLARHTLLAPTDGTILRTNVSVGQMIGPEAPMPAIWFAPDRPKIVRCEIDQAFADRVAVGMRAEIHDDDQAGRSLSGVVEQVGPWIAPKRSILDEPFLKNDVRTLECIIRLDPADADLRIGHRLRVSLNGAQAESASVR